MPNRKVVLDKIEVHNNGDRVGKGEMYWRISANTRTFSEVTRKDSRKVKDGETIFLSDDLIVKDLTGSETLQVSGNVSERDGILAGADESASFTHQFGQSDSWGVGSYDVRLSERALDVTLSYRIVAA